jgi:hypothetical protein
MTYFVTFGQRYRHEPHPTFPAAHPDGWVEVSPDYALGVTAYELVNAVLGTAWASMYGAEFDRSLYSLGCLGIIDPATLTINPPANPE